MKRPRTPRPAKPRPTTTGLPEALQAGVEALTGHSLDGVKVHYNSAQPAQWQAHAQGTDVHGGPGQGPRPPRESGHLVQQQQAVRKRFAHGYLPGGLGPLTGPAAGATRSTHWVRWSS